MTETYSPREKLLIHIGQGTGWNGLPKDRAYQHIPRSCFPLSKEEAALFERAIRHGAPIPHLSEGGKTRYHGAPCLCGCGAEIGP